MTELYIAHSVFMIHIIYLLARFPWPKINISGICNYITA